MSFEEQARVPPRCDARPRPSRTPGPSSDNPHDRVARRPQVSVIRESVAAVYEAEESWTQAAQMLAGIDLDSGQRQLDALYKLQKCIKIAQLYLVRARRDVLGCWLERWLAHQAPRGSQEDDDALSADKFIQKAGFLLSESKDEALELQYNTCYARILDSKVRPYKRCCPGFATHGFATICVPQRKFIEAALRYYHLSQLAKREIGAFAPRALLQANRPACVHRR